MPEDNKQLHMFANEVVEWVIAYSPEDAAKVWEETVGEPYLPDELGGEFVQLPDEKELSLVDKMEREPVPANSVEIDREGEYIVRRATCRAWCDSFGRSYFGSTEF